MEKVRDIQGEYREADELAQPEEYQKFLSVAFQYADTICLTYNREMKDFRASQWGFLHDSVVNHEYTRQTPVTNGPSVLLLYLRIDKTTKKWLQEKHDIYDFDAAGAERLEDLCFCKDGSVIFNSCTHEEFCYIASDLSDRL